MTPKQKAKELFSKYSYLSKNHVPTLGVKVAKQCALIAVEEQINLYNQLNSLGLLKDNSIGFELIEVKQEIEKL